MFKKFGVHRKIGEVIEEAINVVVQRLLTMQEDGVSGREEELTSQIRSEITNHLLNEIKRLLDNQTINGVEFKVYTYKKKEEHNIGADLAGFVKIKYSSREIVKAYLAQAKVCSAKTKGSTLRITGNDPRIQSQANDMLRITSDSFFFLYTDQGIYVTPALEVQLLGKNSIDTDYLYYKKLGSFYQEFFKCFIGDHHIAPIYNDSTQLGKLADNYSVANVIIIEANIPGDN